MKAIKNEVPEQNKQVLAELLLVVAEVNNETHEVKFGARLNENILIEMCKTDSKSWEVVKKITLESLSIIEEKAKKE